MFGDPFADFTTKVDTVATAGGTVPANYTKLADRWRDYCNLENHNQARLTAALTDPNSTADLAQLHALALAEAATPIAAADVTNAAKRAVLAELRTEYAKVAQQNYLTLAAAFDDTAAKFTKAAAIVDPEASADAMVTAGERERKAWTQAALAAVDLTTKVSALVSAASLAGAGITTHDTHLPLLVDTEGHHRRRVWEAWDNTDGRTGRWGALVAAGVMIRTAGLDDYTPYRRPKPMEETWVRGEFGHQRVMVDPEDMASTTR